MITYAITQSSSSLKYSSINNSNNYLQLPVDGKSTTYFEFGTGFAYKRFSGEARFSITRNIIDDYLSWESDFNTFNIIFGYKLF